MIEMWLVSTTLVALALAGFALLCERALEPRPALRHGLWLLVLVKLALPPLVAWPAFVLPAESVGITPVQAAATLPTVPDPVSGPRLASRSSAATLPVPVAAADHARGVPVATSSLSWASARPWLLGLWALGAAFAAMIQVRRILRLRRAIRGALPAPPELVAEVTGIAQELGAPVPRTVLHGADSSPLVVAFGRPILLLPATWMASWDGERRRSVLAHELAHLARRDHWTGWLELVVAVAWWWNPLVAFSRRRLHENAELACDARVVALSPNHRRAYAETLLEVGAGLIRSTSRNHEANSALAFGMAPCDVRSFERRLTMVMQGNAPARLSTTAKGGLALLAMGLLPAFSMATAAQERRPVEPVEPREPARSLDEDERWSATLVHEERLADGFENLVLATGVGSIHVQRGSGDALRIEATVKADDDVSEALKTKVFEDHVLLRGQGNTLEVHDAHKRPEGEKTQSQPERFKGWSVSLKVTLPRGLAVRAHSGVGSIVVEAASGAVELSSGAGSVTAKLADATITQVDASSGAGSVHLDLGTVEGISATSGAGDVNVHLVGPARGDVSMSSGAGSLELIVPASIAGEFDVEAGAGSVKIAPALGLEVDKRLVGASARGAVGGGGPKYRIHTGAGSIEVKTDSLRAKSTN